MTTRRDFLKHSALGAAGLTIGGLGFSTESFANIMGANEKIRVGIVGFSDRARHSLIPAFMACADELGFETSLFPTFGNGVEKKVLLSSRRNMERK